MIICKKEAFLGPRRSKRKRVRKSMGKKQVLFHYQANEKLLLSSKKRKISSRASLSP